MISSNPNRIYDSNLQDKSSHDCIIDKSNPINNISNDIIQINLFDPVVIIRGNVNESVGSLLRGEIILTLNKPMKIGSIELKFIGRTKIVRPNGAFGTIDKYKEEIISQNINLLSHSTSNTTITSTSSSSSTFPIKIFSKPLFSSPSVKERYYTFSSGTHKLSFEIHLPGSLPGSVKSDSGSVKYKLKFKIDYITTLYLKTLSSTREVEIIRMLTDYINYSGIEISRSYDKIIDYQLSIPKKSYTLDDIIPINIKIIPLIKQFRLHSIECFLLQKITYMKDDDHTETIKNSNYNNIIRFNEHYDKIYETNMNFELNKCRDIIIHHSVDTPLIRIKHELRFCLLVSITKSDYGIKSKLYFNIGINLLSRLVRNDDVLLPNYDDVSFYCPCHPEYQRIAELILGNSYNNNNNIDDESSCDGLTCNFCNLSNNNKPPRYSKTI
ncbi:unnamed protein product [Rhizophagus irregularis]|uniref:Arrestin C-terminal-like domain-containing protein n=1 Tax=Rhizophagus irregularis TaxID=588596 RepID=A0A2N1N100_9GLOM|nr:hypothetical protein RhiirC2_835261 [Rhizophagus irregularis]CAB4381453.1 unnamed protein product [Rhizophagus irregularis]CAB5332533.1 unnamed protein product [Rhizophagus irregularis]